MSYLSFYNLKDDCGIELKIKPSSNQTLPTNPIKIDKIKDTSNLTLLNNEFYSCLGIPSLPKSCTDNNKLNSVSIYVEDIQKIYINNINVGKGFTNDSTGIVTYSLDNTVMTIKNIFNDKLKIKVKVNSSDIQYYQNFFSDNKIPPDIIVNYEDSTLKFCLSEKQFNCVDSTSSITISPNNGIDTSKMTDLKEGEEPVSIYIDDVLENDRMYQGTHPYITLQNTTYQTTTSTDPSSPPGAPTMVTILTNKDTNSNHIVELRYNPKYISDLSSVADTSLDNVKVTDSSVYICLSKAKTPVVCKTGLSSGSLDLALRNTNKKYDIYIDNKLVLACENYNGSANLNSDVSLYLDSSVYSHINNKSGYNGYIIEVRYRDDPDINEQLLKQLTDTSLFSLAPNSTIVGNSVFICLSRVGLPVTYVPSFAINTDPYNTFGYYDVYLDDKLIGNSSTGFSSDLISNVKQENGNTFVTNRTTDRHILEFKFTKDLSNVWTTFIFNGYTICPNVQPYNSQSILVGLESLIVSEDFYKNNTFEQSPTINFNASYLSNYIATRKTNPILYIDNYQYNFDPSRTFSGTLNSIYTYISANGFLNLEKSVNDTSLDSIINELHFSNNSQKDMRFALVFDELNYSATELDTLLIPGDNKKNNYLRKDNKIIGVLSSAQISSNNDKGNALYQATIQVVYDQTYSGNKGRMTTSYIHFTCKGKKYILQINGSSPDDAFLLEEETANRTTDLNITVTSDYNIYSSDNNYYCSNLVLTNTSSEELSLENIYIDTYDDRVKTFISPLNTNPTLITNNSTFACVLKGVQITAVGVLIDTNVLSQNNNYLSMNLTYTFNGSTYNNTFGMYANNGREADYVILKTKSSIAESDSSKTLITFYITSNFKNSSVTNATFKLNMNGTDNYFTNAIDNTNPTLIKTDTGFNFTLQ